MTRPSSSGHAAPAGLPVGTPAPDFCLRDQHGADVASVELRGAPLLVVFYPWAFSGVCTGELRALEGAREELASVGGRVVGISCDAVFSQRAFADAEGVGFPLLSDSWPHGAVAAAYGVLDEVRGCPRRSSYLLDAGGVVRWALHHPLGAPRDVPAHLEAVRRVRPA